MDTKRFWNKMASSYDKQALGKYRKAYEETISISKRYLKPTDRLLDFACGTGIITLEVAKAVQQVVAIDYSVEMIRVAKEKATQAERDNIVFKATTINDPDLKEGSFDIITAFNILHGLEDIGASLNRISSLLKPNGTFLSVTDCLGEKTTIVTVLYGLFSTVGLIPKARKLKRTELLGLIVENSFTVVEEKNLYPDPPNCYIAARKADA